MMLCPECLEIRKLQVKPRRTEADDAKIEQMQKKLHDQLRSIAVYRQAVGKPAIELHPYCDCHCHFVPITTSL